MKKQILIFLTLINLNSLSWIKSGEINQNAVPTNGEIAFASDEDGDFEIFSITPDGANIHKLTSNTSYDGLPDWSPNGSRILFTSDRDGAKHLYTMNADGSNQAVIMSNLAARNGRWNFMGDQIAFVVESEGRENIYIANTDGSNAQNLTHDVGLLNRTPFWSRDGNQIYFLSNRDTPIASASASADLYLYRMNLDGSNVFKLFSVSSSISSISLSSSEDRLVTNINIFTSAIVTKNIDGSAETVLTDGTNSDTTAAYPTWSANGDKIAYALDGNKISVMNTDGSNNSPLFIGSSYSHVTDLDWQSIPKTRAQAPSH